MRVLQISRSLEPTGGIARVAHHLAREFRRAGVAVENIGWYPRELPAETDLGARRAPPAIARVAGAARNRRLRVFLEVVLFSLWSGGAARRALREGDIILSHGDSFMGDVFVAHSCHRAAVEAKRAAGERRWMLYPLHWFVLFREALVFRRRRPHLIAISRGVADEFRRFHRYPDDRIHFIPNGVDRERFRPAADKIALRRELGLPEEKTLLLFVGHEFARKGLSIILEGMAGCAAAEGALLLVAGGDDPSPYVERARALGIAGRVLFLGARSDVHRLYAAADLFVFLSNYESCPLVGLEALASGLPVITTRVSGMEDFIRHGENGFFVERNEAAFTATLGRVIGDADLRARISAAARPSTEPYAWAKIAARTIETMERIGGMR
ncbi:MAG: glycosyltransferase family 4 protein [Candidatus Eisenbacteria bacterium]|nr:glycosyltransferase family 4 protein [Candidatus Eisenbacteria bacterium]